MPNKLRFGCGKPAAAAAVAVVWLLTSRSMAKMPWCRRFVILLKSQRTPIASYIYNINIYVSV